MILNWLVWDTAVGALRAEGALTAAARWWLALQGDQWERSSGIRHTAGIYEVHARRRGVPHGQRRGVWIIRADLPAELVEQYLPRGCRWDPAQKPLYPYTDPKRSFDKVDR